MATHANNGTIGQEEGNSNCHTCTRFRVTVSADPTQDSKFSMDQQSLHHTRNIPIKKRMTERIISLLQSILRQSAGHNSLIAANYSTPQ